MENLGPMTAEHRNVDVVYQLFPRGWLITHACIMLFISVIFVIMFEAQASRKTNEFYKKNIPSSDRYKYFDAELLEALSRDEGRNVLVSPLIVKIALTILMEGAGGRSAEEIRIALRLSKEDENSQLGFIQEFLQHTTRSSDKLKIGSQIFASDKLEINPKYISLLYNKYNIRVTTLPSNYPRRFPHIVNDWVTMNTDGKITHLVDESQISSETNFVLANAIYFKGKWLNRFLKGNTKIRCFETSRDGCLNVPMMSGTASYGYAYIDKLDAYAINLPYEDNRFFMLVVLPKRRDGSLQLARDMIHVSLEEIISQLRMQEVYVEIPRFSLKISNNLIPYLQKLNIIDIFTSDADFPGIYSRKRGNLLSNILHSAKLSVDEEGVEGAAAVASFFVPLMGGTTTTFTAIHPFLFFIRDNVSGSVLFSGKVERPEVDAATETELEEVPNRNVFPNPQTVVDTGIYGDGAVTRNETFTTSSYRAVYGNNQAGVRSNPLGKVPGTNGGNVWDVFQVIRPRSRQHVSEFERFNYLQRDQATHELRTRYQPPNRNSYSG